jgi:hypothetical protein
VALALVIKCNRELIEPLNTPEVFGVTDVVQRKGIAAT